MNIDFFFTFFTGIFCDYDGADGDQCFDLANAYSRWIGGQRFTGATADLIYQQSQNGFYIQIANTINNAPQRGDLVIWNWPHVGIATGNNTNQNQFEVLEQNDPEGSNCHIKIYANYNGVIGWIRPKQLPTTSVNPDWQPKASQYDLIGNYLFNKKLLSSANTNSYLNNNGILNAVQSLYNDDQSQRIRAGWYDQVCQGIGLTGDTSQISSITVLTKIKSLPQDVKNAINQAKTLLNSINLG